MEDHLLYRAITGSTSPSEQRAVEAWRGAASANEARYESLRATLELTRAGRVVDSAPPPVLDVLAEAARRERAHGGKQWVRRTVFVAAGVAAMMIAGVALDRSGVLGERGEFGFEEMVTGENQTVTVALRDGSVMRLAPRSRARIRVRDRSREVHLTGHAFFAVAKRNGQPFMVKTQGGDVTVLGTQFDLDATNNDLRLVVVEGRVALAGARGGTASVERGQEARVVEGVVTPAVVAVETKRATQWLGRFFAFQGTPVREVAQELERTYGAHVTIADSTLGEQTVTNWFSDRSLAEVVRVVCAVLATECTVQGSDVTMGKLPH